MNLIQNNRTLVRKHNLLFIAKMAWAMAGYFQNANKETV